MSINFEDRTVNRFDVYKDEDGCLRFNLIIDYPDSNTEDKVRRYGLKLGKECNTVGWVCAAMKAMVRKMEYLNGCPLMEVPETVQEVVPDGNSRQD